MSIIIPWYVFVCLSFAGTNDGEQPVPAFNSGKIKASYVVSLPSGYDQNKSWPLILDKGNRKAAEAAAKLRKSADAQIMQIMTDEQKANWQKMIGKPFQG